MDIAQLYIDFLKKTLTFMLWDEPNISEREKTLGRIWPPHTYAHTMIGLERINNIQLCIEAIIKDNIPGDFIETGVWRGGSCIFMKGLLEVYGHHERKVFVADSFKGLPPPDPKYPKDAGDNHYTIPSLAISRDEVESNFKKYGLLDSNVVFIEGWFKDTMPLMKGQYALIRLDGDMYESTFTVLQNLYPKLSAGGFCIIDDWALPGAKAAVIDYCNMYGITASIIDIDGIGGYWRKA